MTVWSVFTTPWFVPGPVCLSGQYSEPGHDVAALLRDDLAYARGLGIRES